MLNLLNEKKEICLPINVSSHALRNNFLGVLEKLMNFQVNGILIENFALKLCSY